MLRLHTHAVALRPRGAERKAKLRTLGIRFDGPQRGALRHRFDQGR